MHMWRAMQNNKVTNLSHVFPPLPSTSYHTQRESYGLMSSRRATEQIYMWRSMQNKKVTNISHGLSLSSKYFLSHPERKSCAQELQERSRPGINMQSTSVRKLCSRNLALYYSVIRLELFTRYPYFLRSHSEIAENVYIKKFI